jgi:hypothetical protein
MKAIPRRWWLVVGAILAGFLLSEAHGLREEPGCGTDDRGAFWCGPPPSDTNVIVHSDARRP